MGKKKPFIDKKKAETFTLIRRSQRDVGGYLDEETGEVRDVPNEFILWPTGKDPKGTKKASKPSPAPASSTTDGGNNNALALAKKQLQEAGLVDNCDYDRFMKPITGDGMFISKTGEKSDGMAADTMLGMSGVNGTASTSAQISTTLDETVQEVDRQYEAVVLTADCMEDDVAEALFDFEEGDFEEILDDFCFTASQEPTAEVLGSSGDTEQKVVSESNPDFDFDQHFKSLIEKAKKEENGGPKVDPENHNAWQKSQQEFAGMKARKNKYDQEEDDDDDDADSWDQEFGGDEDDMDPDVTEHLELIGEPGIVPKLGDEEEKALCDKFEQTLLEYDSDEIGDLDEKYDEIVGEMPLEGDINIDKAMDQFLQDQKDGNFMDGTASLAENKRNGGSSHVLVGRKLVPVDSIEVTKAYQEGKIEDVLAEADEALANPEMDLPPEEVLIDGKSYFTMKEQNPWDCESILSTYSNLDNNPATIGSSRRRQKKNRNKNLETESVPEDGPVQIRLSNKTGLPLGVLPSREQDDFDDGELTFTSVNRGVARKKGESKEEKRLRKEAVKQEKQIARLQKKMMREAFDDEFSKYTNNAADDTAGKTVYRL